jgi:N-acetylmuramoyl-L-alanine amidase
MQVFYLYGENSLSLKKTFFIISLVSFVSLLLITGCGPQSSGTPYIPEGSQRIVHDRLIIPTITPSTRPARTYPKPIHLGNGSLNGITIIVDAGHGGSDPGAGEHTLSSVPEKTITLAISKELETRLRAKGAKVIMSRTSDKFVDLDVRAAMPGRYQADLLVSIHADSISNRYISGTTVYVANNCSYKSNKVAQKLQASFENSNIKCRGIRNKDFRVLAKHSRPAVLVECGYMTNAYEVKNLNNSWYRKKLATTIANGIANSF